MVYCITYVYPAQHCTRTNNLIDTPGIIDGLEQNVVIQEHKLLLPVTISIAGYYQVGVAIIKSPAD
jgi:hypothetical protein